MVYREASAPERLRGLAECLWTVRGPRRSRILPDGCMDLIDMDGVVLVAGPDTEAFDSEQHCEVVRGIRFRPGVLPRLLGVPAAEVRNHRVALRDLRPDATGDTALEATTGLLAGAPSREAAPWPLAQLHEVTARLAGGAEVGALADELGWSARTVQRQCTAAYGYGPSMVRRVLRFRRAVGMVRAGTAVADAAARAGYADQPHLYRDVREFAGVPLGQLCSGANKSTEVPSGSVTVA
ncbi:helix-turn-helix domain-containing protein [Mycolicibacterium baixiangningiae]|uniref:helix-turn-helix domain-containing protein n=1 Tax=Mycolicibacterium baixiangningiae TaxID=2761578 RepID=UPI001866B3E3|nr:helix-turn-helix domain-containing protein [Mycolicibacterium baixiangningiae]